MYNPENIFAKIIRNEIPAKKVYEDEAVLAFEDVSPAANVHILVIPKGEYKSFNDFAVNAGTEVVADFFAKIQKIAKENNLEESGYRLITNHGDDASQTVHHFHVHILGGEKLGGLLASDRLVR